MPAPLWEAVLPAAIGGVFSALGASKQNKANRAMAREQMAFQERMSSTAYQRSARDLEAGGLNRILALGSPASSPGGQTAQMQNVGKAGVEGAAAGINSALALRRTASEIKNIDANTAKQTAETLNVRQTQERIFQETELTRLKSLAAQYEPERMRRELKRLGLANEQQQMLINLYRDNPKLMLGQQFPWSGVLGAISVAGGGVMGSAALLKLYKVFKGGGYKGTYTAFKKIIGR